MRLKGMKHITTDNIVSQIDALHITFNEYTNYAHDVGDCSLCANAMTTIRNTIADTRRGLTARCKYCVWSWVKGEPNNGIHTCVHWKNNSSRFKYLSFMVINEKPSILRDHRLKEIPKWIEALECELTKRRK